MRVGGAWSRPLRRVGRVGEDAVYEHLLTFGPKARKTTDAASMDDTETP